MKSPSRFHLSLSFVDKLNRAFHRLKVSDSPEGSAISFIDSNWLTRRQHREFRRLKLTHQAAAPCVSWTRRLFPAADGPGVRVECAPVVPSVGPDTCKSSAPDSEGILPARSAPCRALVGTPAANTRVHGSSIFNPTQPTILPTWTEPYPTLRRA